MLWLLPVAGVLLLAALRRLLVTQRPTPPARLTEAERARLLAVLGEADLAGVEQWLHAAHVNESLGWGEWYALGTAHRAIVARRMDVVRELVGDLDELSRRARASLLQVAAASVMIRDTVLGQLELNEAGYNAATRTFEFLANLDHNAFEAGDEHRSFTRLRTMLDTGHDANGNVVDVVRVVFVDEDLARRSRLPLLDAGAEVVYMDRRGDLIEIAR